MKAFVPLPLLLLLFVNLATEIFTLANTISSTYTSGTLTAPTTFVSDPPTTSLTTDSPISSATSTPDPSTASTTFPTSTTTIVTTSSSQRVMSTQNYVSSSPTHITLISSVETTTSPGQNNIQMPSTMQGGSSGSSTLELSQEPTSNNIISSPTTSNTNFEIIGPGNHCQDNPCGGDASCVNLYYERICLCMEGYYYSSMKCFRGKTFPGQIVVTVTDTSDLQNEGSLAYQDLWTEVNTFFEKAFVNTDYKQTVVHKVSTSPQQARSVSISIRVVNIFAQNTTENEMSVYNNIKEEEKNSSNISRYIQQDQCDYYGCENIHQDNCSNIINCQCKDGLERPFLQSPFCLALQCSEHCKPENNKQCLKKSTGELTCACLPGYSKTLNNNCQKCPFGYSGMDCEDQFQLILTIVGTISGVLILSLVIGLVILMSSKNRKKNIEEQNLIENDFQNLQLQQTGFSNPGAEGNLFPRVKTSASRDHQNPYIGQ